MKLQLKLLKGIKHLFGIVLLSGIVFSCSKDKNYGTIYYFEQKDMFTTMPLNCNEIINYSGLRRVELTDKEIYELLILSKKEIIHTENNDIDVRYKIEIDSDVFCIGYSGYFFLNDEQRGKLNFINKIEKFISENKNQSTAITEPTPKPW